MDRPRTQETHIYIYSRSRSQPFRLTCLTHLNSLFQEVVAAVRNRHETRYDDRDLGPRFPHMFKCASHTCKHTQIQQYSHVRRVLFSVKKFVSFRANRLSSIRLCMSVVPEKVCNSPTTTESGPEVHQLYVIHDNLHILKRHLICSREFGLGTISDRNTRNK